MKFSGWRGVLHCTCDFPLSYSSGVEKLSLRNQTGVEIGVKSELGYLALSLK